jgi:hypothetical protein
MERIPLFKTCRAAWPGGLPPTAVLNDPEKNTWCVENAFCDLANRKCAKRPGDTRMATWPNVFLPERCGNDIVCAAGLGCSTNKGGRNATCQLLRGAGWPCLFSERYEQSLCYKGSQDDPGYGCYYGKCNNFVACNGGCSCTTDKFCWGKFYCSWSDTYKMDVCWDSKKLGQACEQGQCATNLVCSSGKCADKKSSGSCSIDEECTDDRYCYNGSCMELPVIKAACTARCPTNTVCRERFDHDE